MPRNGTRSRRRLSVAAAGAQHAARRVYSKWMRTGQMIGERYGGIAIGSAATHGASAQACAPKPAFRRTRVCGGKEGLGDQHRCLRQFWRNAKSADFRRLESHAVLCFQAVTANSNQQHRRLETDLTPAMPPRTPFLVAAQFADRSQRHFIQILQGPPDATLT